MPYIPEEHKKYPVLPYSREHGGEVFQYNSWPYEELDELIGDHLMPYGYKSYEEYFAKIDGLIRTHSKNPEAVRLLGMIKKRISKWNQKEEWSICRFIGGDIGDVFGVHYGGYYYWPCMASNPKFAGVIDDEEFTAYQYPTDPNLWEIVVDPTGMAQRTIYGGVDSLARESFDYIMNQVQNLKPEDLDNVETLGSVPRLNECEVVKVRVINEEDIPELLSEKEYDATVLENGKLLVGDGNGRVKAYPAELFEVLPA